MGGLLGVLSTCCVGCVELGNGEWGLHTGHVLSWVRDINNSPGGFYSQSIYIYI